MQFKSKIIANQKIDKAFYETMFLFSVKCLKDAFPAEDLVKLEEEVARLFRSNAFNMSERNFLREEREKAHPTMKLDKNKIQNSVEYYQQRFRPQK